MDLTRYRNRHGSIWLNVASSVNVLEDFLNIDNSIFLQLLPYYGVLRHVVRKPGRRQGFAQYAEAAKRAPVLRHDCRRPLPFPAASVDHILCSHFLEHVHPEQGRAILEGFHDRLAPGGTLHVIVPDLSWLVDRYIASRSRPDAADELVHDTLLSHEARPALLFRLREALLGHGLRHRWMYDEASLRGRLAAAGFRVLDRNDSPSAAWHRGAPGEVNLLAAKPA